MKDLKYFKNEFIRILNKQLKEGNVKKSFTSQIVAISFELKKSLMQVGEISTYRDGSVWRKIQMKPAKWKCIRPAKSINYKDENKNSKIAIKALIKKIQSCTDINTLHAIIVANKNRFVGIDGNYLSIYYELKAEYKKKNENFRNEGQIFSKFDKKIQRMYIRQNERFDFDKGNYSKNRYRKKAKKLNIARKDDPKNILDQNNLLGTVSDYLDYMMDSWNKNFVISPFFNNVRIRFDGDSKRHLFKSSHGDRSDEEIERRAKCLPFVRDIIEKSGAKCDRRVNERGQISYAIVGKAIIDNKETCIKIVVTKKKKGKYYYLSVNNLDEIKKQAITPTGKVGSAVFTTSSPGNSNIPLKSDSVNQKFAKDICKDINELKDYAKKNYDLDIVYHGKNDFEKIRGSFHRVELKLKEIPELKEVFSKLVYTNTNAENYSGVYKSYEKVIEIGNQLDFEPFEDDSIDTITEHELQHAVTHLLCLKMNKDEKDEFNKQKNTIKTGKYVKNISGISKPEYLSGVNLYCYNIVNEALNQIGITREKPQYAKNYKNINLQKYKDDKSFMAIYRIDRYATVNDNETVSMAIQDVYSNGKNASPLSLAIKNIIDTKIKKMRSENKTSMNKSNYVLHGRIYLEKSLYYKLKEIVNDCCCKFEK